MTLVKDKNDAADLVQDTFLRACNFYYRFELGTNVKAWLFTIMRNIFYNNTRMKSREMLSIDGGEGEDFFQDGGYPGNPRCLRMEPEVFKKDIQAALDGLPRHLRVIVVLKDMEGFNYKEISEILNCPMGTVMSRLARGRSKLKRALVAYQEISLHKAEGF